MRYINNPSSQRINLLKTDLSSKDSMELQVLIDNKIVDFRFIIMQDGSVRLLKESEIQLKVENFSYDGLGD